LTTIRRARAHVGRRNRSDVDHVPAGGRRAADPAGRVVVRDRRFRRVDPRARKRSGTVPSSCRDGGDHGGYSVREMDETGRECGGISANGDPGISNGRRGSDTRNTASGAEAVRTALALGHRLVPIFGKSRVEVNDPEAYAKSLMDAVLSGWTLPDTRVAVPQDWMKGRRGEVDDINGLVAREQRRLGGRAPVNEKLVENSHKDRKPSANGRSFERRSFAVAAPGLTREQALNS
jgi:hypothetical protein